MPTPADIAALRSEAIEDQDWDLAADCDAALAGDPESLSWCARVIYAYGLREVAS